MKKGGGFSSKKKGKNGQTIRKDPASEGKMKRGRGEGKT